MRAEESQKDERNDSAAVAGGNGGKGEVIVVSFGVS